MFQQPGRCHRCVDAGFTVHINALVAGMGTGERARQSDLLGDDFQLGIGQLLANLPQLPPHFSQI